MCLALPGRIVAIEGVDAIVDLDGRRRRASLLRRPDVVVGDWALVAAGAVIRRIEPEEAGSIRALLRTASAASDEAPSTSPSRFDPATGGPR